jgi:hypothetical protein
VNDGTHNTASDSVGGIASENKGLTELIYDDMREWKHFSKFHPKFV